jgi:hypothetical protein
MRDETHRRRVAASAARLTSRGRLAAGETIATASTARACRTDELRSAVSS